MRRLLIVAAIAAAVRLVHLLAVAPHSAGLEDAFWFHQVGLGLADGRGFARLSGPLFSPGFHYEPTAIHPPLYPLVLGALSWIGITGDEAQRALGVPLGALTVLGVGLLGRELAGERVGIIAALLAAFHPLLIAADGALLAETLYAPIVVFTLIAAVRRRPVLVGIGIGLATLTRSEALLFVPFLAVPLFWRHWRQMLVAVACTGVVVAPWVARNWITFDRPLLSTNEGELIAISNCQPAYYGRDIGFSVPSCSAPEMGNEAQAAARWQRQGLDYAGNHLGRLPLVGAVRLLRAWSLFRPFQHAQEQGRSANVQRLGIVYDWLLFPLALAGVVLLRRRSKTIGKAVRDGVSALLVLLAPVAVVTVAAVLTFGTVRYRIAAEPSVCVLAAVAISNLASRWIRRSEPSRSSTA